MKAPFARLAFVFSFIAVASYALVTLRGPNGIPGLLQKNREIDAVEKRYSDLAQEVEHKRMRIKRLRDDTAVQELEIRRSMKLVAPNEKVYIVGDSQSNTPPATK